MLNSFVVRRFGTALNVMSKLAPRCLETFEHKGNKYEFFNLEKLSERYGWFCMKISVTKALLF